MIRWWLLAAVAACAPRASEGRRPFAVGPSSCRVWARGEVALRARRREAARRAQLDEERRIVAAGGCVLYGEGTGLVDVVYLERAGASDVEGTLRARGRGATVRADPAINGVVFVGEPDEVRAMVEEALVLDCLAPAR